MYICVKCGSVCHFVPLADCDGRIVFICSKCGHSFTKTLMQVLLEKDKVVLNDVHKESF